MKKFHIAIVVSIVIHATLFIGISWWAYRSTLGLGGGGGMVEVGIVGGGEGVSGPTSASHFRANVRNYSDATPHPDPLPQGERGVVPSPHGGEGVPSSPSPLPALSKVEGTGEDKGEGEGASDGSGGSGIGTGTGRGDPRLAAIWKKINRAKYYPEIARRQGLEGIPKIAFSINEDGRVKDVKLLNSCGHDILDHAAVEAVEKSSPLPFYPQPITIAVRYSLKGN